MYDSTLDFIFDVSPELGEKIEEFIATGNGDESTANFVARMEVYESEGNEWWLSEDHNVLAYWQLHEPILLMDFSSFHGYVEKFLGHPVFTHEFGLALDELRDEANSKRDELGYF